MMIVIDACVAVKWFLKEADSDKAAGVLERYAGQISVPDLFAIEVLAALVRNGNIHKAAIPDMRESAFAFAGVLASDKIEIVSMTPGKLLAATQLAFDLGHPLKDCLYLTLAMELECPLVTADARFAAKARGVYGDVRALGEV